MGTNTQPLVQLPEWCVSGNINYQHWNGNMWELTGLQSILLCQCSIGGDDPAERCTNNTAWEYNGYPICMSHMQEMYTLFPGDREALAPALKGVPHA